MTKRSFTTLKQLEELSPLLPEDMMDIPQDTPKDTPAKPISYIPEPTPVIGVDDIGGETAIADPTEALGYRVSDVVPQDQDAPKQVLGTKTNLLYLADSEQSEPVIPITPGLPTTPQKGTKTNLLYLADSEQEEGPDFLSSLSKVNSNPNIGKGIVGDTTYKNIINRFTEANKTIDTLLNTVKSGVPKFKGVQKSAKGGMVTDTSSVVYHNPKQVESTLLNVVSGLSDYYTANKNNVSKEQGVELTIKITQLLNKVQGTGSTLPDLNRNILIDAIRNLAVDTASFVVSVPEAAIQGIANIAPNVDPNIMKDSGPTPSEQVSSLRRDSIQGEGDAAMWAQLGLSLIPAMFSAGASLSTTTRILSTLTSRNLMQAWALNATKVVGPAIVAEAVGSITMAALNDAHETIANTLVDMGVESDIAKALAINPEDSRWDRFIKSAVSDTGTGLAITPVVEGLSIGVKTSFSKLRELTKKAKTLELPLTNTIDPVDTNIHDLLDTDEDFIDPFRNQRGFMDLKFMESILEYIKPTLPKGTPIATINEIVQDAAEKIINSKSIEDQFAVSIVNQIKDLSADGITEVNLSADAKSIRLYMLSKYIKEDAIENVLKHIKTHSDRVAELNKIIYMVNPRMDKVLTGLDLSSSKVTQILEDANKFLKSSPASGDIKDFIDKLKGYEPTKLRNVVSGVIQKSNTWLLADPINRLFDFVSGSGQHFVENFATAIGSGIRGDMGTLKIALKGMAASPFVALNHSGKHGKDFVERVLKHKGLITPGRVMTDEALPEGTSKLNKWIQIPYIIAMRLDEITKQNIYWTSIKAQLESLFPKLSPDEVAEQMLKFGNPKEGYRFSQANNYANTSLGDIGSINKFVEMDNKWKEALEFNESYKQIDDIAEEAALRATFQQDPRGLIGTGTKQLNRVVGNVPELGSLWKFFRTGSNLLQQVHTLGPTGAISAPIALANQLLSKKQQKLSKTLGRFYSNTKIRNEIVHDLIKGSDVQKSRALGLYVISVAASTSAILAYLGMSDEEFEKADPKNSTVSGRALPAWQNARRLAYEGVRAIRNNKDSQALVGTEWWEDVAIGSWGALKDLSYNHPIAKPLVVDPEFSAEYDQEDQFYDTALKTALQSLVGSVMAYSGPIGMVARAPAGPIGRSVGDSLGLTEGSSARKAVGLPSIDSPEEFGRVMNRKLFDSTGFKGYEAYDSDMDSGIGESDLFGTGFRRSNIGERIPANKSIALRDPTRGYSKDFNSMSRTIRIDDNITVDLSEHRHHDGLSVYEAILDKANSIRINGKTLKERLVSVLPKLDNHPELKNKTGVSKKILSEIGTNITKPYYDAAKVEVLSKQGYLKQIVNRIKAKQIK